MTATTPSRFLDPALVEDYRRDGFLLLGPDFLPSWALPALREATPRMLAQDGPERVLERDGTTVRSVYGPHRHDETAQRICRSPQLVGATRQLLGDEVYVHQSKINVKAAFSGDQWEWHQDYINWLRSDGIRKSDLVNVAIFLDDVTEFNGPLTFVPGSHHEGLLTGKENDGMPVGYEDAPDWVATLTATEKVQIDREVIRRLALEKGLVAPKGTAGSVMFFHSNVLHASAPNMSPFDRRVLLMVYNGVDNPPTNHTSPRPEFLADRDNTPLPLTAD